MQRYKLTLILTAEEFMDLVPHLGPINGPKIEKLVDKTGPEEIDPSALRGRAPRGKRKSKVVEIILDMVGHGQASAADLRGALSRAGMSESSLSTGLAVLQKSGQIKRGDDGDYYLSAREAA